MHRRGLFGQQRPTYIGQSALIFPNKIEVATFGAGVTGDLDLGGATVLPAAIVDGDHFDPRAGGLAIIVHPYKNRQKLVGD